MEDNKKDGHFVVKKISQIGNLKEGDEIMESDLCFQNEERIVQCEYVRRPDAEDKKFIIEPGVYSLAATSSGIICEKLKMKQRRILTSYDNSQKIMGAAKNFFSKKEVYDFLGKDMKRAILLYSPPGFGKTCAITRVSQDFVDEDPGTVVISWPTADINSNDVARFLSSRSEYSKECTRLIFIIEDIGGSEVEGNGAARGIDSALLNLLDGVDVTFKLPTFIIATTNYPENLLDALADRPGRFDEFIELEPPTHAQRVELVTFISRKEALEEDEINALKKAEGFSVAHLSEIVERSLLKDMTYLEVIEEMINHKDRFSRNFEKRKKQMGIMS